MKQNEYPPFEIPSIEETRNNDFFPLYVKTLKKIFAEILGWTEAQTEAHIEQELQQRHFRVWFGHATPSDDAASVIVPLDLKNRLIARRISTVLITRDIQHVLEGTRETYNMHPDMDINYDWQRAKNEITTVVKKYELMAT